MCGRLARDRDADAAAVGFYEFSETRVRHPFEALDALAPVERPMPVSANICPTDEDVCLVGRTDGTRALVRSRWGLLLDGASHPGMRPLINARAETLLEKPRFRELLVHRRCVIPASGFYEWQRLPSGGRQQMFIRRKDRQPLALAGLWSDRRHPVTDEVTTSHLVITCAPNALMSAIHNRMPVLLGRTATNRWLDPGVTEVRLLAPLLLPCPNDLLEATPLQASAPAQERRPAPAGRQLLLSLG